MWADPRQQSGAQQRGIETDDRVRLLDVAPLPHRVHVDPDERGDGRSAPRPPVRGVGLHVLAFLKEGRCQHLARHLGALAPSALDP